MERFVNEYRYTPELAEESVGAWWKWKNKKGVDSMLVCMVMIPLLAIFTQNMYCLMILFLPIAVLLLLKAKAKKGIQTEKSRLQVMHPNEAPMVRVEICENISLKTEETSRTISFSDIEDVLETQSLIVLCMAGMMTIALDKNGFVEGTAERCLDELRQRHGKR